MSTGDIQGKIAQLQRVLKHLKYPTSVDTIGLTLGDPLAVLHILNFVLLKYSRHVAAYTLSMGVQLQGKTDEGFVKAALRLFREHMGLKVVLTSGQFLEQGFAERKLLLLYDVVKACRELHLAGVKQERTKVHNAFRQSPAKLLPASPIIKATHGSVEVQRHLHKLPATAATDDSQAIYELLSEGTHSWVPKASPARSHLSDSHAAMPSPSAGQPAVRWPVCSHKPVPKVILQHWQHGSGPVQRQLAPGQQQQPQQQQQSPKHGQEQQQQQQRKSSIPFPAGAVTARDNYQISSSRANGQLLQHWWLQSQQQQPQQRSHNSTPPHCGSEHGSEKQGADGMVWHYQHVNAPRACLFPATGQAAAQSGSRATAVHGATAVQQEHHSRQHQGTASLSTDNSAAGQIPGSTQPWQGQQQGRRWQQQQSLPPQVQEAQWHQFVYQASPDITIQMADESEVPQQQQLEELEDTSNYVQGNSDATAPVAVGGVQHQQSLVAAGMPSISDLQQQLTLAQQTVQDLQQQLASTESELQEQRLAAARFQEATSARMTVLEGRLKFLENQLNSQQQQQQQQPPYYQQLNQLQGNSWQVIAVEDSAASVGINWRAAASAAASAVVTGLASSPLKQAEVATSRHTSAGGHAASNRATKTEAASGGEAADSLSATAIGVQDTDTAVHNARPAGGSDMHIASGSAAVGVAEQKPLDPAETASWTSRALQLGLAGEASSGDVHGVSDCIGNGTAGNHTMQAQNVAFGAHAALAQSYRMLGMQGRPAGKGPGSTGACQLASSREHMQDADDISNGGSSSSSSARPQSVPDLIDKLANRAMEAQRLLARFKGK